MVYYIDNIRGDDSNDGLSSMTPKQDYLKLTLKAGDTVLFKRGSIYRGGLKVVNGEIRKPVTYDSYGPGSKPVFLGSQFVADEDLWKKVKRNVWVFEGELEDEPGNLIFDNGNSCGVMRWSEKELKHQGEWFFREENGGFKLMLYSTKNPAIIYSSIECSLKNDGCLCTAKHDVLLRNICFENCSSHGFSASCQRVTIEKCVFRYIGGAVLNREKKLRYGNAVDIWNFAFDLSIRKCLFDNIYDSGIAQRGDSNCEPFVNMLFENNLFVNCGLSAYEVRDRIPINSLFSKNICVNAGKGFASTGEKLPRMSEIWPNPVGHHIFIWKINRITDGGSLELTHNTMCEGPLGATIFSLAAPEPEEQVSINFNRYYTENEGPVFRYGGESYFSYEFPMYRINTGNDLHSEIIEGDIYTEIVSWFESCY
ncbi:MAG: hypothetical protein IJE40_04880 [Clostridia bacterium]|nr:hypothetical protein [Clostridia bacterium]